MTRAQREFPRAYWPARACWRMPITRSSCCIWSRARCASFSGWACSRSAIVFAARGGARSRSAGDARVYAGLLALAALATIGVAARQLYIQSLPPG